MWYREYRLFVSFCFELNEFSPFRTMGKILGIHMITWATALRPPLCGQMPVAWTWQMDSFRWLDRPPSWHPVVWTLQGCLEKNITPAPKITVPMRAAEFSLRRLGCSHKQSRYLTTAPGHLSLDTRSLGDLSMTPIIYSCSHGIGDNFPNASAKALIWGCGWWIGATSVPHCSYGSLWLVDLYQVWPYPSSGYIRSLVSLLLDGFLCPYKLSVRSWPADYQVLRQTGHEKEVLS